MARHRIVDPGRGWQTLTEHHEPLWQEVMPVQQRSLTVCEEVLR